jgi:SAM-dependent methyltransferase
MTTVIRAVVTGVHTRIVDPLHGSSWSQPGTVSGFAASAPNATLLAFARTELARGGRRALDLGCGAGRNLLPLTTQGWNVVGLDLSRPMALAAAHRIREGGVADRAGVVLAPMDALPVLSGSIDLIVAHGIWNLARSGDVFRRAVGEAARVARAGAALFVFTFSRRTLPADADPVDGEAFVFTRFSGEPQCFLTEHQLIAELGAAGFIPDGAVPLTEHNVRRPGIIGLPAVPVIYEAAFRFVGRGNSHARVGNPS